MYKHILIPTDGSDLAQKAVTHGLALAKSIGAKVTMMMATKMWSALDMTGQARQGDAHPVEDYEARHSGTASKVLAACKAQADAAGVDATTMHVQDMEPDAAIVETAKVGNCDLILMASHGRGPIGRMLLGSVALKVLTSTSVPVQIIR